ncbi:CorA family divalent cation transporter [Nocardioides sp. HB32]
MAIDTDVSDQWRTLAALRVADELMLDPGRERLAKVSSLLHTFSSLDVHSDVGDIERALSGHGVTMCSPREDISRREVVELKLAGADISLADDPSRRVPLRFMRCSRRELEGWRVLQDGTPVPDRGVGDVVWFDVDPQGADPEPDVVHQLSRRLEPHCPGLKEIMVRDLLTPDVQPKSETYGDERTGARTVSVAALIAREVPDEDDEFDGVDEQLLSQMVELVVGPGWMITCWHPCKVLTGGGRVSDSPALLREPFLAHVAHRWAHDPIDPSRTEAVKEASDLATYLARSLVATYGASLRMLQRWVSTWEVEFYQTLGSPDDHKELKGRDQRRALKDAAAEISNFLSVVGVFSRSVNAFQLAGEEMPNKTWFTTPTGQPVDELGRRVHTEQAQALASSVEAAARKLAQLSDEIRADMDLLMIHSQARQQESSERLQGYLGKVTGLILVPTFVAGLYGANTALPGGGSWMGFDIMLLLMAASAAISYLFIRRIVG